MSSAQPSPREELERTWRNLNTPGAKVWLYGRLLEGHYLDQPWQQHLFVLTDVRPAYARDQVGLPRAVILRPGSQLFDNALREYLGQRTRVVLLGTTQGTGTVGNETVPLVVVDTTLSEPEDVPPRRPAPTRTPTPTPAPGGPTVTPQMIQQVNDFLRQMGLNIQVNEQNINEILQWLRQSGIEIQIESHSGNRNQFASDSLPPGPPPHPLGFVPFGPPPHTSLAWYPGRHRRRPPYISWWS